MFFNFDHMELQIASVFSMTHTDGYAKAVDRPIAAISYRLKGSGDFVFADGSRFTAREGDVSFFPQWMNYEAVYDNSEIIVIHLSSCNYKSPENIHLKNSKYIYHMLEAMLEGWTKQHSTNLAKSNIYGLFAAIDEDQSISLSKDIRECSVYIQEHFPDPDLRISDICNIGHMSESSLYRHFCNYFGLSPKQYLLNIRLNSALELLLKSESTVSEVAMLSGFEDVKYFSRAFKKRYGAAPVSFKQKL